MKKSTSLADLNRRKYAQAPSWEQIAEFMNEMNMPATHFEKFYGIPFNTLAQVKEGSRKLPMRVWHIVYEKIKPAYGAGFLEDYNTISKNKRITKSITQPLDNESHTRITKLQ